MKFSKLLKETQFHGGRRLADKKCRWMWCTTLLALFFMAVGVICVTIRRFMDNPTYIVHLKTTDPHMEFPSVLVCPEILFRDDKIDRFLNHVKLPPTQNQTYIKSILHMLAAFFSPDVYYKLHDLVNIEHLLEYNNISIKTAGRMLTTSCKSTFIRCRWESEIVNCSSLFQMELTGDGFCCVFNGRTLNEDSNNPRQKHMRYVHRFGYTSGLTMVVNQTQTLLSSVDLNYKWLGVQTSQHFVETSLNGTPLSPGHEQWARYTTSSFQIAEGARSLSHELRKCRLGHEPLKFFPSYEKRYCMLECEVARTVQRCNCVSLVHPRPDGVPYCSSHKLLCAKHAKARTGVVSFDSDACHCPPTCDMSTGTTTVDSFSLNPLVHTIEDIYSGVVFGRVSIVRVFVDSREIEVDTRWSVLSHIDLFSQLGGVFGMFFGCSILTLLEVAILVIRGSRSVKFPRRKIEGIRDNRRNKRRLKEKNLRKFHN